VLQAVLFLAAANTISAIPQFTNLTIYPRDGLPPVPPQYDPDKDTLDRYVSKRCTIDQMATEAFAWAEAGVLANAFCKLSL